MVWLERHAWWALLAFAAFAIVVGLGDIQAGAPDNALSVTGMTNDQLAAQSGHAYALMQIQVREAGMQVVVLGALVIVILLYGFRRRQRWAWWALWSFPIYAVSLVLLQLIGTSAGQMPPFEVFTGSFVAVIAAAVLLVSARAFFRGTPS